VAVGEGEGFDINLSGEVPKNGFSKPAGSVREIIVSGCPSCKSNLQVAAAKLRKEEKPGLR